MAWIIAIAGLAAAGIGYAGSSETNSANEDAKQQSVDEANRLREVAGAELEKAYAQYNKLREDRPGLNVREFLSQYEQGLTDENVKAAFRRVKEEDFAQAAGFSTKGTVVNTGNFLGALNSVSGGRANDLRNTLNNLALNSDAESLYKRALELQSTGTPAGTVKLDSKGRLIENQASNKRTFNIAYDATMKAEDRQWAKARDLFNDYQNVSDRMTDKAKEYLNFSSYEPVARGFAEKAMNTQIEFQMQDERAQLDLIKQYAAAAAGIQPQAVTPASTAASDALTAYGIQTAIKGFADASKSNNNSQAPIGSYQTTSY